MKTAFGCAILYASVFVDGWLGWLAFGIGAVLVLWPEKRS